MRCDSIHATECIIRQLGHKIRMKTDYAVFLLFCFWAIILSLQEVPTENKELAQQARVIRWLHVNFHKAPFSLSVRI